MRDFESLFSKSIPNLIPGISTTSVVFGFKDGKIQVLVSKLKEMDLWMLPTGYVFKNEDVDNAARRIIKSRVGAKRIFLDQFYTFGQKDRITSREENFVLFSRFIKQKRTREWFNQRFISIGFISLINIEDCELKLDDFSDIVNWAPIDNLPYLIIDHKKIIESAFKYLKTTSSQLPIGSYVLPEKFTMRDLQTLYEELFKKKMDRGNFQKRILKLDILNRHEKKMSGNAHRAPFLYSINKTNYSKFKEDNQDILR